MEGWEQVYADHYRRLVALLAVVCGSRGEAEELVQEAFVRALGVTGRRAVLEDPQAWLYRVAVNLWRSRWRRLLVARRKAAQLAQDEFAPDGSELSEQRLILLAALRRLPLAQREALTLHYFEDLSVDQISAWLKVPSGTVKARLARGRAALAELLSERNVGRGHV